MTDTMWRGAYDSFADVLYLTAGASDCIRFDEDDDGLIWRYPAGASHPSGVTIREFEDFWRTGRADLVRTIAVALHESERGVRAAIHELAGSLCPESQPAV